MLTVFFGQACKAEAIDTSGLTPALGTWEEQQEKLQRLILLFRGNDVRSVEVCILYLVILRVLHFLYYLFGIEVIIKTSLKFCSFLFFLRTDIIN